ncbi:MAG: TetR/AcrR family transcriptional regulator [Rhizomicrobium sp.]|jgi:AcrR family transcriptional regulator
MPKPLSEPKIQEFRDQFCDAATRLFAERGAAGVSIRDLAAAVGVSAMTPYRYFTDKDEILAAVRARAFDRFADALETAHRTSGDSLEKMRSAGRAYVRFAFAESAAYRLMFDTAQPGEERYPDLLRAGTRARATMTRHIDALIADGILEGDPVAIGHVMWATLHGAIMLKMAGKLTTDCRFEQIVEDSFSMFLTAFAAKDSPR